VLHARRRRKRDSREFQQFALLRVAGLFDDRRFQRRVMVLRVVLLQDVLHVVRDLVDLEREEQRLGLEIARLQDEQHPTCQAVVAIGHRAFFRCEGEIVDALIVREPGTAVELFDLGVFENCDAVLVSSGHGGSLFLRGPAPTCLYTVPKLTPKPKQRAMSLACADATACSRRLQSRQRAL